MIGTEFAPPGLLASFLLFPLAKAAVPLIVIAVMALFGKRPFNPN